MIASNDTDLLTRAVPFQIRFAESDICSHAYPINTMITNGPDNTPLNFRFMGSVSSSVFQTTTNTSCLGNVVNGTTRGVFFTVHGNNMPYTATTCQDRPQLDTQIAVFTGTCESRQCLAYNDNLCGTQASVTWQAQYNELYYIYVFTTNTKEPLVNGQFELTVRETVVNDICEGAVGPILPDGVPVTGSSKDASLESLDTCGLVSLQMAGVWYSLVGTGNVWRVSETNQRTHKLSILTGDSCHNLQCVVYGEQSELNWRTIANQTYYVVVEDAKFSGGHSLAFEEIVPPDNDLCQDAIGPLAINGSSVAGTLINATMDEGSLVCNGESLHGPQDVWYIVTGNGQSLTATVETLSDVMVAVFTGPGCGALDCVVAPTSSSVTWDAQVDTNYWILVNGTQTGYHPPNFNVTVTTQALP